jgi:hypothetical protein
LYLFSAHSGSRGWRYRHNPDCPAFDYVEHNVGHRSLQGTAPPESGQDRAGALPGNKRLPSHTVCPGRHGSLRSDCQSPANCPASGLASR